MTRVSAIICTRGRPDLIGKAVASVLANDHDSFDVVVLDQSEDDATKAALSALTVDDRLNYVHLDRAGLSHAYNAGIAMTSGPLLAFTDDDCIAPTEWLTSVESAFERNPDVDMLYGQTIGAPELADAPGSLPAVLISHEEKLGVGFGFRIYGMGANFALRRELVERIGGFDEVLGGGGPLRSSQDFDFQFRAYRAGAICLLTPEVWVHHYGIRDGEAWTATQTAYGIGDGAFYLKHIRCRDLLALRLLMMRLGRLLLRAALNPIRQRPSQWSYTRGYFTGMKRSLSFRIDPERRLYRLSGGG